MKAIVTVTGTDRKGIIAGVSQVLAGQEVNILDISQTVLQQEYFAMIMLVDLADMTISLSELNKKLAEKGKELGVAIKVQREDIFHSMHQV